MILMSVLLSLTGYRPSQMSLISFKIGTLICEIASHSRMKCSIFLSPLPHMRQVGSILFTVQVE